MSLPRLEHFTRKVAMARNGEEAAVIEEQPFSTCICLCGTFVEFGRSLF